MESRRRKYVQYISILNDIVKWKKYVRWFATELLISASLVDW